MADYIKSADADIATLMAKLAEVESQLDIFFSNRQTAERNLREKASAFIDACQKTDQCGIIELAEDVEQLESFISKIETNQRNLEQRLNILQSDLSAARTKRQEAIKDLQKHCTSIVQQHQKYQTSAQKPKE